MNELKTSRLSAKGQTTIPIAVRRLLHIEPGDAIAYEVRGDEVLLRKLEKVDMEWARAVESTLTEWKGSEDDDL